MYYSEEDDKHAQMQLELDPALNNDICTIKFAQKLLYYEGFVKIFDEGYQKSLYVNSFIPFDNINQRFFFIGTRAEESWIHLLVKAVAKYLGSYDKLNRASLETLSSIFFGSQPSWMKEKSFDKIYAKKFDKREF